MSTAAEDFYAGVLQNLRAWKAAPPKLKKAASTDTDEVEDAIEGIVSTEPLTADEYDPEPTPSTPEAESSSAPLGGDQNRAQGFTPPGQT